MLIPLPLFFFLYINSYIELYKILRAKACSDHYWSSLSLTLHAESSPASVGTPGREAVQNTKQRSAAQRRVLQWGHRRILQRWKTELWKLGHTVWFLACAGGIQQKPKELKWVHNQKLELWVGKINNKKKKGGGLNSIRWSSQAKSNCLLSKLPHLFRKKYCKHQEPLHVSSWSNIRLLTRQECISSLLFGLYF